MGRVRVVARRGFWALSPLGRPEAPGWQPELPPVQRIRTARGELGIRLLAGPGGPSALPPVLLLHGVTWNGALNYHAVMGPLAQSRTVVVMDHRGHGDGLPVEGRYTMADLADDAAAVLDELGISRVVVVGFSLGSLTALHLAARHPDRVAGQVLTAGSLVLRPGRVERWVLGVAVLGLALLARLRLADSVPPRYFGLTRRTAGPAFAEAWPWIRQQLAAQDQRGLPPALRAALAHDVRPLVRDIARVPSCVVVHEHDGLIPSVLQRAMARELGATTIVLDADHEAPLSHPAEYRDAVLEAVERVSGCSGAAGAAKIDGTETPSWKTGTDDA